MTPVDLNRARELEQLRYTDLAEKLNVEERQQVQASRSSQIQKGTLQSGQTLRLIAEIRKGTVEKLIAGRIDLRRQLIADFSELGNEAELAVLSSDLERLVSLAFKNIHQMVPGFQVTSPTVIGALDAEGEQETMQLKAQARRQVEMLRREVLLGLHLKEEFR